MSLFDQLVDIALESRGDLAPLRVVVEKELLHHDILREMSQAGLLKQLTFFGGTCLRACYGSDRLSEDLDFTGGYDFKREMLTNLKEILIANLQEKYGLEVAVSEPVKDKGNVDTWKIKVTTRPEKKHLPLQRINIDVCALPSYDKRPMALKNYYDIDMGTFGLIIQVQSRSEILADKIIAFGLRPNRLKSRDLWDIGWLKQRNIQLPVEFVLQKIKDHHSTQEDFLERLITRLDYLKNDTDCRQQFIQEMRRFLPPRSISETVENPDFWAYLQGLIQDECQKVIDVIREGKTQAPFKM